MPNGKPAGIVCIHLDENNFKCRIWNTAEYPKVCKQFAPEMSVCGDTRTQALRLIDELEKYTSFP